MNSPMVKRWQWILWFALLAIWMEIIWMPVSHRWTRGGSVALVLGLWGGLLLLCWQRRGLRWLLLGVALLAVGFFASPGRSLPPAEILRSEYVAGLRRYEGTEFLWGGESPRGIDCSGLIRRGLIDAQFLRGLRTADPGLARRAVSLWWRDCTAKTLGEGFDGAALPLLETPSLNELDHTRLLPGDFAVTQNGSHILAYLGDQTWIEADPLAKKVITVVAPAKDNAWFRGPMKVLRWKLLAP
jgi:hypothetical protein